MHLQLFMSPEFMLHAGASALQASTSSSLMDHRVPTERKLIFSGTWENRKKASRPSLERILEIRGIPEVNVGIGPRRRVDPMLPKALSDDMPFIDSEIDPENFFCFQLNVGLLFVGSDHPASLTLLSLLYARAQSFLCYPAFALQTQASRFW